MTEALKFVPPRVPLVTPATGIISREWYMFFQGVFDRIGGSTGPNMFDLVQALPEDAGLEELKALLYATADSAAQSVQPQPDLFDDALAQSVQPQPNLLEDALAEIHNLREELAELTKTVQALQQGVSI